MLIVCCLSLIKADYFKKYFQFYETESVFKEVE